MKEFSFFLLMFTYGLSWLHLERAIKHRDKWGMGMIWIDLFTIIILSWLLFSYII